MERRSCPLCHRNCSRSYALKRHFKVAHRQCSTKNESPSGRFERYTPLLVQGRTVHPSSEPKDNDTIHLPPPNVSNGVPPPPPLPPASSDAYPPSTTTATPVGVMGLYRSSLDDFYNPLHVIEINSEHIYQVCKYVVTTDRNNRNSKSTREVIPGSVLL